MVDTTVFINPNVDITIDDSFPVQDSLEAFAFHKKLPGYKPSPLIHSPLLAKRLGVKNVWVKDESSRFGLPAFKFLGASWAIYKMLLKKLHGNVIPWHTFEDLKRQFEPLHPLTLVAATDGNHGRAVAHMAKLLGFEAHIFVPNNMTTARIEAIRKEGAEVTVFNGDYDETILHAAQQAKEHVLVVSDTAWEGYTEIPRWIMEGYITMFNEIDNQLDNRPIDLFSVPIGVGGLATTSVWHYRRSELQEKPKLIGVEPNIADCMLQSMKAGHIVEVPGPHMSIMAGLNCGVPSLIAFPILQKGINAFVGIDDEYAKEAMRLLATEGIISGETGGASLGGLLALLNTNQAEKYRELFKITSDANVLIISTEGATDPFAYQRIVGQNVIQ